MVLPVREGERAGLGDPVAEPREALASEADGAPDQTVAEARDRTVADAPASETGRAGFVALVGRPNAGKSTLLNAVLGRKLAIVTPKPQTTRHRILGIATQGGVQYLFVDTPGLHAPKNLLGERMVGVARQSLADADVGLWVVDATESMTESDRSLALELAAAGRPVVVALNKIDRLSRGALLVAADGAGRLIPGVHVVPVSARRGDNVPELLATLAKLLPESPPLYPPDAETDLPERFFVAELVREQVLLATHEEVPYQSAVRIESFIERSQDLVAIQATIVVARASQRGIVIGRGGSRLKEIGRRARIEIEELLGARVYLELIVRVDERWFASPTKLGDLGL